uniref:Uncharacterized protein n=1 Tax=Rhizophora mucronata TaxID=61149 RepID=A0A2P2QJY6_RHIMU
MDFSGPGHIMLKTGLKKEKSEFNETMLSPRPYFYQNQFICHVFFAKIMEYRPIIEKLVHHSCEHVKHFAI